MKLNRFFGWASSRTFIAGEIALLIFMAKACSQKPQDETTTSTTGTVETGGSGGTGGSEDVGGSDPTGTGGEAGAGAATGGSGGSGTGATGGAGGSGTSTGGSVACEVYTCGAKDCGLVDDGCPEPADCGGCGKQSGNTPGPMTCGADNLCECPAEGDTPEAVALCNGAVVQVIGVADWCASQGGCHTALCGTPPVPKVPTSCHYGGALADETQIWCCAATP